MDKPAHPLLGGPIYNEGKKFLGEIAGGFFGPYDHLVKTYPEAKLAADLFPLTRMPVSMLDLASYGVKKAGLQGQAPVDNSDALNVMGVLRNTPGLGLASKVGIGTAALQRATLMDTFGDLIGYGKSKEILK